VVDLLWIDDRILPLGAVVWAAVGKSLGFTPEGLINEVRRLARYIEADFRRVASDPPVDPAATITCMLEVLDEADAFVARMPTERSDCCFCKRTKWCSPSRTGWTCIRPMPASVAAIGRAGRKIAAAMMERYKEDPNP
jgi:hypothetical protein